MFTVKNCWGTPVSGGVCASKHSLARVKKPDAPPRGRNMVFRKTRYWCVQFTCTTLLLVDQSSPDFIRRTREESLSIPCFSDFWYLHRSFRRYSRSNFKVVRSRHKFCTFLAPNFFFFGGGEDPPCEFFDRDYKIEHTMDHVAQIFRAIGGRRSRTEKKERNHSKT